jgi:hypothetical protein
VDNRKRAEGAATDDSRYRVIHITGQSGRLL